MTELIHINKKFRSELIDKIKNGEIIINKDICKCVYYTVNDNNDIDNCTYEDILNNLNYRIKYLGEGSQGLVSKHMFR